MRSYTAALGIGLLTLVAAATITGISAGVAAEYPSDLDLSERVDIESHGQTPDGLRAKILEVMPLVEPRPMNPTIGKKLVVPAVSTVLVYAELIAGVVFWLRGWIPSGILLPLLRGISFVLSIAPLVWVAYISRRLLEQVREVKAGG